VNLNKVNRLTLYGVLTALALILSYIEASLPAFVAIPGMKLGLTNIVVMFALYAMGERAAGLINITRILIAALLFGSALSLAFSLTGGILSLIVMIIAKRTGKLGLVGVSILGGLSHNIGQILVAMIVMNTNAIALYLPVLWITGIISGIVIGVIGALIIKRVPTSKL
jgi:heptaprenyl diphosphate synthase